MPTEPLGRSLLDYTGIDSRWTEIILRCAGRRPGHGTFEFHAGKDPVILVGIRRLATPLKQYFGEQLIARGVIIPCRFDDCVRLYIGELARFASEGKTEIKAGENFAEANNDHA